MSSIIRRLSRLYLWAVLWWMFVVCCETVHRDLGPTVGDSGDDDDVNSTRRDSKPTKSEQFGRVESSFQENNLKEVDSLNFPDSPLNDHNCTNEMVHCLNSTKCIMQTWICDDEIDCPKGEDESKETCENHQFSCPSNMLRCGNLSKCYNEDAHCDGFYNCENQFDEHTCPQRACKAQQFRCYSGQCIDAAWLCDNEADCTDGSDEKNCTSKCQPGDYHCGGKKLHCIPQSWKCDGQKDCSNGDDEGNCSISAHPATCHIWEGVCDNGACIQADWICDGNFDCLDKSDENNCSHICNLTSEFKCYNNECIPIEKRCDRVEDCRDWSDESKSICTVSSSKEKCADTEINCNVHNESANGECINADKLCSSQIDCLNMADEKTALCEKEPSKCDKKCSDVCLKVYSTFQCACHHGRHFKPNSSSICQDLDECSNSPFRYCSQSCQNFAGSYSCHCMPGYYLVDKHICLARQHPRLLLANRISILLLTLKEATGGLHGRMRNGHFPIVNGNTSYLSQSPHRIVNSTRNAIAVDYGYREKLLFWSDEANRMIHKAGVSQNFRYVLNETVLVSKDVRTPDGLAFDWIGKNLYWTDSDRNEISVVSVNAKAPARVLLISKGLDQPRAIAVDPVEGWLYWTDWGKHPRIEKSALDGRNGEIIVKNHIQWPNGLTIDFVTRQLYWIDAKLHTLCRSNLDGTSQQIVLHSSVTLNHPFAVSVFEDQVYWSDWYTETVHSANKWNGSGYFEVSGRHHSVMDVNLLHPLRQPEGRSNHPCRNSSCSHMCLAFKFGLKLPHQQYSCHCPADCTMGIDNHTCTVADPAGISPSGKNYPTTTVPSPQDKLPPQSQPSGHIALVVISILVLLAVIVGMIGYSLYRSLSRKSIRSLNFDNPVYRKTTEEQVSLDPNQFQPSNGLPASLEPLSGALGEIEC